MIQQEQVSNAYEHNAVQKKLEAERGTLHAYNSALKLPMNYSRQRQDDQNWSPNLVNLMSSAM